MQTSVVAPAEEQHTTFAKSKSLSTVPRLLLWLVLACLLPAVLAASALFYFEYLHQRTQLQKDILQSVRANVQLVDAQLAQTELFAQLLAKSGALVGQDIAVFSQRLASLLRESHNDLSVVLYDKNGQQLVNSNIPWGQTLPKSLNLPSIQQVFNTGRPSIPSVIFRSSDGLPVVRILVPVVINQKVTYALAVGIAPKKFKSILSQLSLGSGAVASIIDSTGTIAARTDDAYDRIGKKTDTELLQLQQLQNKPEGVVETISREGAPHLAAYSFSPRFGWGIVIAIPRQSVEAPLRRNLALIGQGAFLLLFFSLGLAWFVGKRIANAVRALREAAIALGEGTSLSLQAADLRETNEVSQALQTSAYLLKRRTQELMDANETLQHRTAELGEAQNIAKIGSWKWNSGTDVFVVSEELLKLYGRKILIPYTQGMKTIFPKETWKELKTAAKQTFQTGIGFSLDVLTLRVDATQVWMQLRCEPVNNAHGEVVGLRGTVQDISQHRDAETARRENEARLNLALASADLAMWDWHIQSGDLFCDARWAAIQGYALNELPSRIENYMQNVYPEDIANIDRNLERHYRGEIPKYDAIYRVRHKDGRCLWIQGSGKVVERDAAGNPVRMLGVAWDISQRKHNESVLEALHDEMEAMLVWQAAQHTVAALAHEINQPLASLSILCEAANRMLMAEGLSDAASGSVPKRLEDALQRMSAETARAGTVVRNLMSSVNQPNITRASVSVNELIAESIQVAIQEAVFVYQINRDINAGLPNVNVNRLQVIKVLLNLLHNSMQAMQAAQIVNGQIWITTALVAGGREICVSVRDEGPGISDMLQQEIFQPFITTKPHGLGMGLTISRALIEAHGGKLWHSRQGEPGAIFHFTLPISR